MALLRVPGLVGPVLGQSMAGQIMGGHAPTPSSALGACTRCHSDI